MRKKKNAAIYSCNHIPGPLGVCLSLALYGHVARAYQIVRELVHPEKLIAWVRSF